LLESAAREELPVYPATLHYDRDEAKWYGEETFGANFWRLLALPRVEACLSVAGPAVQGTDRKELAAAVARSLAAAAPAASLSPEPPNNPFSFARQ
jgi:hypothetical protein